MGEGDSQENVEEEEKSDVRALQDAYTQPLSLHETDGRWILYDGRRIRKVSNATPGKCCAISMHRIEEGVGEDMQYTDPAEGENRRYFVSIRYQDGISMEHSDRWVESFSDSVNFEGEPEIKEDEDKRIYFGKTVYELEYTEGASHVHFAYIFSIKPRNAI